jgi:cytochrome oxidase Cu insertion factor (SCO1/SenC/PrrC family)
MTNENPPGELSEEQRRAVFREELAQTTAHGGRALRPKVPPRFVLGVAAAFISLGLGGAVLEHFYGGGGSAPQPTTTLASTSTTTTSASSRTAEIAAFIGLKGIASAQAPPVVLRDQSGRAWRLSQEQGRVVLLTFYAKDCRDICPVLGAELREALDLLHVSGVSADVAIINTDPHDLAFSPNPAALSVPGLAGRTNVQFLTGTLNQLNSAWANYGVVVRVGAQSGQIAHNNVLYFIDPRGRLRALAIPFGHEDSAANFSLSASNVRRFAQGIATEASSLAR